MSFFRMRRNRDPESRSPRSDVDLPGPEFAWEIESRELPDRFQMLPAPEPLTHLRPGGSIHDYIISPSDAGEDIVGQSDLSVRARYEHRSSQEGFARRIAAERVAYVRHWLDGAVHIWRRQQELPGLPLLRDGLLLLETGAQLPEEHRLMLLRTALVYRRGIVTALRHQLDPERTAALMAEAALRRHVPLSPAELLVLRRADPEARVWFPLMTRYLSDVALLATEPRFRDAQRVLAALRSDAPGSYHLPDASHNYFARARTKTWLRLLALVLVAAIVWLIWFRLMPAQERSILQVPGGQYLVSDGANPDSSRIVISKPFRISRSEVANRAYRLCYERHGCTWPASVDSATRTNYFLDPAFDAFPVVNVTWLQADRYCRWQGGRLPEADEWEIAAGAAIGTNRKFIFPWGDHFVPGAANGEAAGIGDTTAIGQYHPAGSSPVGLWDAAGNVAEWTATPDATGNSTAEAGFFVVKGGSFQDQPEALRVAARQLVEADISANWLGFRCTFLGPRR